MLNKFKLSLPTKNQGHVDIETTNSFLFVGANGAGKTRLGTWIEFKSHLKANVHRIGAQKSLTMPDSSTSVALDLAEMDLLFGSATDNRNKQAYRWSSKPAVSMLSDFEKLMVYLFSDYSEQSSKYLSASKASPLKVDPPITKLDKVKTIWERILPHRRLEISSLRIKTSVVGATYSYDPSEMSDGERVIFYLIGQCLAAPSKGTIVVDEPELHLHRSIQEPLWTEIERLRPDCLFIYLTHDVDFAATKASAKKIWLKAYDEEAWDWETVQPDSAIPENLLLEVLGSRRPVVFVEGTKGSFDAELYTAVLPKFLVIPAGSCHQVIQMTKALKDNSQLHHLKVYGIVDRDRRVPVEIQQLEAADISVLNVAEVENLFCTKEVMEIISNRLARDADADFHEVSNKIFTALQNELDVQISLHVVEEVKHSLKNFDGTRRGATDLSAALISLVASVDVPVIYQSKKAQFDAVIASRDYAALLALYNRKSLSSQASALLGLASGNLPETVVRLAKSDGQLQIATALKGYFGTFANHMG